MFSDKEHFGCYINKQNHRKWDDKNLRIIHEKPTHPNRVTVWCP